MNRAEADMFERDELAASGKSSPGDSGERRAEATLLLRFGRMAVAFVLVRLPWIFTIPMQEAPDEFAHYWVIKFLHQHWRLPSALEVHAGGPSAVYGSLPQFGYLPHLFACSWAPVEAIPLLSRFGSLAMGLVLLYAAWRCAKIIFAGKPLLIMALPLALLFHPQMIFLHAYANCDATSSALSGVLVWLMLETLRSGVTIGRVAWMGLLAGWLALTKYSALAILPVLALAVVSACFLHSTALAVSLPAIAIGAALAAGVSFWWFIRNAHEFHGDFLGTGTMYNTWATTFHRELSYHVSPWRIIKDHRWWRMMFFSFWGMFGYMNKYMWRPVYLAYVAYLITAALGVLFIVYGQIKPLFNSFGRAASVSIAASSVALRVNRVMWICLALVAAINLASMIWASTQNLGGPQGRYLFNSEIPVLALMLAGLYAPRRAGKCLVISFLAFNAAVAVGVFVWLFQLYGGLRLSPL